MTALIAPVPYLVVGGQQAIHGADGTEIAPLIEERGVNLCRSPIDEARLMENIKHRLPLGCRQGAVMRATACFRGRWSRFGASVQATAGHPDQRAETAALTRWALGNQSAEDSSACR